MKSPLCLSLFILLLLATTRLNAQSLLDSAYYDVIEYNDINTQKIGTHYLTTVPLDISRKPLILYNNAGIPDSLFFSPSFNPEVKQFILISPRKIRIISMLGGGHGRTKPSMMLYYVRRENKLLRIDSVEHREKQPQLHFYKFSKLPDEAKLPIIKSTYPPNYSPTPR